VAYFLCFYGELMGASGKTVFPEWVFVLASGLRWGTVAVIAGYVVRDIMRPEHDAVRRTYADDPDGGDLDGAPDAPYAVRLRRLFSDPDGGAAPAGKLPGGPIDPDAPVDPEAPEGPGPTDPTNPSGPDEPIEPAAVTASA
jgi:hypothetical protein